MSVARAAPAPSVGDKPVPRYIRRSLLCLRADDPALRARAHDAWADAVILDFERRAGVDWQADLRARMPAAVDAAGSGGSEVFVRAGRDALMAELDAIVCPGLAGVVLCGVLDAADIEFAAERLDLLERERGLSPGSLEIDIQVNTAATVWNCLEIARASQRFGMFLLDEPALCADLGMQCTPALAFDPLEYVKSQLITVAIAAGGQAVGLTYPFGLGGGDFDDEAMRRAVRRSRDTGFKGALCPTLAWVRHCNEGFRPTPEESAYYVKVIEVFAEGIRRGMASVPLDGKMIDVPVDVRAKLYLQWANRARARDDEKSAAHRC